MNITLLRLRRTPWPMPRKSMALVFLGAFVVLPVFLLALETWIRALEVEPVAHAQMRVCGFEKPSGDCT